MLLTTSERDWLTRNSARKAASLREVQGKIAVNEREIKLWENLAAKMSQLELPLDNGQLTEVKLNRNECRYIHALTLEVFQKLYTRTIPAYEKRLPTEPKIQKYLDAAKELADGLAKFSKKLSEAL